MIGGCELLTYFLNLLKHRLNDQLYNFILENCYYITVIDSEFNEKDFLFSLVDELVVTTINNNLDDEVMK